MKKKIIIITIIILVPIASVFIYFYSNGMMDACKLVASRVLMMISPSMVNLIGLLLIALLVLGLADVSIEVFYFFKEKVFVMSRFDIFYKYTTFILILITEVFLIVSLAGYKNIAMYITIPMVCLPAFVLFLVIPLQWISNIITKT